MKRLLLVSFLLNGCTTSVKQEDMQALNASIVKINNRLLSIDKDIEDIKVYLNERYKAGKIRGKDRAKFEKEVIDRLDLHQKWITNIMPIHNESN